MNNLPLISVLMATYNDENTILSAIKSIQNQTYKNLELFVLDDASTDNTFELLKSAADNDSRIKLLRNAKNMGLTKSLNLLIKSSNGDIIARHDADDISLPQRIDTQFTYMKKYNLDFCSSRAVIMNSKTKIPNISYYFPKKVLLRFKNPFIHGTLMIKRYVMEEVGNYDEYYYYSQDYKLMITLLNKGYKFRVLKEPLYLLNTKNNISTLNYLDQKKYAKYAKRGK